MDAKKIRVYRHRNMLSVEFKTVDQYGDEYATSVYLSPAMASLLARTLVEGSFDIMARIDKAESNFADTLLINPVTEV
jgi:hypothetical protein